MSVSIGQWQSEFMWENLLRIDIINITVGHLQGTGSKTKLCLLQGSTALVKRTMGAIHTFSIENIGT